MAQKGTFRWVFDNGRFVVGVFLGDYGAFIGNNARI